MTAAAVNSAGRRLLTRSYPGQRRQVGLVRATLTLLLEDCPLVGDAVLIASELAANAVVHSNSAAPGGWFTVRAEACPGRYVRIEVVDQGGPWTPHGCGHGRGQGCGHGCGHSLDHGLEESRPHGLDLINLIVGAGNWGIHGDAERGRTAWARLDWP